MIIMIKPWDYSEHQD